MSCYPDNQVWPVVESTRTYLNKGEVVCWKEHHCLLHTPHSSDCTRCLDSLLQDINSVRAFNDTVELFTALRGIHMVQTQWPNAKIDCQSLEWSCESQATGHVQHDYVILSLWTCVTVSHQSNSIFKVGIPQLKLKTHCGDTFHF